MDRPRIWIGQLLAALGNAMKLASSGCRPYGPPLRPNDIVAGGGRRPRPSKPDPNPERVATIQTAIRGPAAAPRS
jgi:hypothetical protein